MLVIPLKSTQRYNVAEALAAWLDSRHRGTLPSSSSNGQRRPPDDGGPSSSSSSFPDITSGECRDDLARLSALRDVISDALSSTLDQWDQALRALETFHEYHAALVECESRGFPTQDDEASPLRIEWKSAFSGASEVHANLVWERANLLWNIAAIEAYQATLQSCDNKMGWSKQAHHLQAAASILRYLREQVVPRHNFTSVEFCVPALQLWECLFLAQAQRATYEMAQFGPRPRHLLLSKLVVAAVPVLNECERNCGDPALSSLIPSLVSNWDAYSKAWAIWMSAKAEFHDACRLRETAHYGQEIARLRQAWKFGTICREFCESAPMDALEELQNDLDATLDKIRERQEVAETENDTMHHQPIPAPEDLREIRGELLAKADQPMNKILHPLQTPLFTKLLNPAARRAVEAFRKYMDQLVKQVQIEVEEKTESARKALAAVNLPHSLTAYKQEQSGGGIPGDLWHRVETIQNEKRVAQLKRDLWELRDVAEAARSTYKTIQQQLEEDLEFDRLFRQQHSTFEGHEAAEVQKSFRLSLSTYDKLLRKSQEGDAVLLKRLELLDTDPKYKLLQFQKSQLDRLLPGTGRQGPSIDMSQLSRLLVELSALFNERDDILRNLTEEIRAYDIQDQLSRVNPNRGDLDQEYMRVVEAARNSFNGVVYEIQKNIEKQHQLVATILDENDRFKRAREASHSASSSSSSDSCIAMIEDAIDEIDQLATHLKEGKDWYDVVTPKLELLRQQVGDVSVRLTVERCEFEERARVSRQEMEDARMAASLANNNNNNNTPTMPSSSSSRPMGGTNSNNTPPSSSHNMSTIHNNSGGGMNNSNSPMNSNMNSSSNTPSSSTFVRPRNMSPFRVTPEPQHRGGSAHPGVEQINHDMLPQVRVDDEKVASLVAMGFDADKAVEALKKYDNNVEQALTELLSC